MENWLESASKLVLRIFPRLQTVLDDRASLEDRRRMLHSFAVDFANHDPEVTTILDYDNWNDEAALWHPDEGEVYGTSFREMNRLWASPGFYSVYESRLRRFVRDGGTLSRTLVLFDEIFVSRNLERLLLQTGLRQTLLGIGPFIVKHCDVASLMNELGVNAEMVGVVAGRKAYFIRVHPTPCVLRTTNQKYVERALRCYRQIASKAIPFDRWRREHGSSFSVDPDRILRRLDAECSRIADYADS